MWSATGLEASAALAAGALVDLPLPVLLPVEEEELVRSLGRLDDDLRLYGSKGARNARKKCR